MSPFCPTPATYLSSFTWIFFVADEGDAPPVAPLRLENVETETFRCASQSWLCVLQCDLIEKTGSSREDECRWRDLEGRTKDAVASLHALAMLTEKIKIFKAIIEPRAALQERIKAGLFRSFASDRD
jgi:hypothetical protein